MKKNALILAVIALLLSAGAYADSIVGAFPYTLQNGTTADASQVQADLNTLLQGVNTNAAANGANSSITSLSGLTTPLSVAQGGTGAASINANGVVIGEGTSAVHSIVPGSAGTVLTSNGTGSDPSYGPIASVPTGTMIIWTTTSCPAGYLYDNGQAVSRTTYANLFAVIGTTFGTGDGSTTYNLPDMRGYFPRGWADNGTIDPGRAFASTQTDAIASFTAPVSTGSITINKYVGVNASSSTGYLGDSNGSGPSPQTYNVTSQTATYTGAAETRPQNIALAFCIKD